MTNIMIALSSPSDISLLEQIKDKADHYAEKDVNVYLSVASPHRTPATVKMHAGQREWDAIIAGSGLTNALLSDHMKYADITTVMIGLPIGDQKTNGTSSYLSSTELPPGHPAAAVHPGRLDKALDLAIKLTTHEYDEVLLGTNEEMLNSEKATKELLEHLKVPYELKPQTKLTIDDFCSKLPLITVAYNYNIYGGLPTCLRDKGPDSVAIVSPNDYFSFEHLNHVMEYVPHASIGFVGIEAGKNLALFGAKVIARKNPEVRKKIRDYLEQKREKYEHFRAIRFLKSRTDFGEVMKMAK